MKKKTLPFIVAITLLCIIDIECIGNGMLRGMHICINAVVPSLFVFMVLANIIISLLLDEDTVSLPPQLITFLLGNLCGFPVGAIICDRFYEAGSLNKKEARALLPFCNNASPAFLLGVVGITLFKDIRIGWLLLAAQILSSSIPLFFIKVTNKNKKGIKRLPKSHDILFDAIESAIAQILKVCAIICVFSVITAFFERFNLVELSLLLEISNGTALCAPIYNTNPLLATLLCGFCCGFSGICVHLQILSIAKHLKVDFLKLALSKTVQGLLCALFCALGYYLFF